MTSKKLLREILEDLRIDSKKMPAVSVWRPNFPRQKFTAAAGRVKYWAWNRRCAKGWRKFTPAIRTRLYKQNALDFDDLLMLTVKIFENFPKVLAKIPKKVCLYFGG